MTPIYGSPLAQKAGEVILGHTIIEVLRRRARYARTTDPPIWASRRLAKRPPGYRARRDAFADELDARADALALALLGRL